MNDIRGISAKIRNLFSTGELTKRYDDGKVRIKTNFSRTVEKTENFPYGFIAKAKKGKAFIFCQGGNFDGMEIMPLRAAGDVKLPELEEDDSAVYANNGGWIICRADGTVELNGKDNGGVIKVDELKTQLGKLTARVDGIMNALQSSPTAAQDGGASYKAAIIIALNLLGNKENFDSIASEKVKHGNG
ncbi:hypothetical protein FACS189494_05210 [Spirochaetia bacterium]|nr:hypothetical protein FACS189494_05210 [Spirochaetia bacterium]